jgi:hypothetical protein
LTRDRANLSEWQLVPFQTLSQGFIPIFFSLLPFLKQHFYSYFEDSTSTRDLSADPSNFFSSPFASKAHAPRRLNPEVITLEGNFFLQLIYTS